jgi:hypothetical protein
MFVNGNERYFFVNLFILTISIILVYYTLLHLSTLFHDGYGKQKAFASISRKSKTEEVMKERME